MSKRAMVFFTLLLVLCTCYIAGCSSPPSSGTPKPSETPHKVTTGPVRQDNTVVSHRYKFEETVADLTLPEPETRENYPATNVSSEDHIKQIRGVDLDENGDAGSWTFIIEHGDNVSVVAYTSHGWVFSSSPGTYNQSEIFTDQIISPRNLFKKNHDVIFNTARTGTAVTRDLSLRGGYYALTISGGNTPRTLIFDAKTGALTSSND